MREPWGTRAKAERGAKDVAEAYCWPLLAIHWAAAAMQTDWTGYRPLGAIVTQGHGDHQND